MTPGPGTHCLAPSTTMLLCSSLSLSKSLALCVPLMLSPSPSVSTSVSLLISLPLQPSFCPSIVLSASLYFYVSPPLSMSLSLPVSMSLSLSVSVPLYVSLSLSLMLQKNARVIPSPPLGGGRGRINIHRSPTEPCVTAPRSHPSPRRRDSSPSYQTAEIETIISLCLIICAAWRRLVVRGHRGRFTAQ